MKVRARKKILARSGDVFLEKEIGDVFEINDGNLLNALSNDVVIIDYFPFKAEYQLLKPFSGRRAGQVITLFDDEAGTLVLKGVAEPVDEKLWRPGRDIPQTTKTFLRRVADVFNRA